MDSRLGSLRQDMDHRLVGVDQRLTTLMWVVSGWFTFLTAVLAVFAFRRR
jgi:hypothetical protein